MTLPEWRWHRRAALFGLLVVLSGCTTAVPRVHTSALPIAEAETTFLGRWAGRQAMPQEGLSGFALLADGRDAFAVRALLAARAERRLDIQTYLMGDGLTTRALLHRVLEAAERGVRVRRVGHYFTAPAVMPRVRVR